ncbi:hypothetical protein N0V90_008564 [Kalmusia sp. IMI 367209]|nr:hypothetical protein N0V90_008564 [Kalmusia sp. IMI 367209]
MSLNLQDLSTSTASLPISISIRQLQSRHPSLALIIAALHNIFDLPSILDIGVLALTNVNTEQTIPLFSAAYGPTVRPHLKFTWGRNIRDSVPFVSIPSLESGDALCLTFDLSMQMLKDLWTRRSMRRHDTSSFPFSTNEKWRLHFLVRERIGYMHNGIVLWSWGDLEGELEGKKFEYPVETVYAYDKVEAETMARDREEGKYVQVHPNDSDKIECFVGVEADTKGCVIEFVDV